MGNSTLYLVRLGEISLKGLNRGFFERRLKQNIKAKLKPYHSEEHKQKGRLYFDISDDCPREIIDMAFRTTFGVVGYSQCVRCPKEMDAIRNKARELITQPPFSSGKGTFKVESRRSDKQFPLTSYQIDCDLGGVVLETYPAMKVSVKDPEMVLYCEIRDEAYLYTSPQPGPSGLPCTTAGKAMLLLSGGIDSPVACYKMAGRGLKTEAIYFHAYPYTSEEALGKVKKLASLLAPYNMGMRLWVVPFTEPQLWIKDHSPEDEHTLMFRGAMMQVANRLADKAGALAIVTGEALSQVASQTLESMAWSDSMSQRLVLRPLVGMDKQEIMGLAEKIGTYQTSILPYEDCCVIFSPRHPLVRPDKQVMAEHYHAMEIEPLLDKAVSETTWIDFDVHGQEVGRSET
ncbi:MAG: tRNA 4-thiouridine(8) synthase ThiI [Sphaerochaeta sp.]|jgi:thiamine biosynthesis protein ThiI|nr:tRNA 4-thiouridine(8) synthase ThiI [Sphaerochaeta sp.]MCH3920655.1 tRNA 4-thiouridine(8) synthase ThiI [Sphaerochaeta sp.]MCI2045159.1 tRNA 4-thiouridine(8) synthase ThiI [Sphaerochaeta sp.]MCI2076173.1 tRNA 4-thiouridine(8) synthase ThiI [Sphaerochaeta sp.]MCI2096744.1 tRNA 4-thiouridine(8) synthase ThiI [Sphaerochaeta sp.]